jgi:chemotaxis protein CheD
MTTGRAPAGRVPATPQALPGFDAINRYFEGATGLWIAQILPGDFYVSRRDEVISTVLGSCVSTCIRDPQARIGGMNHFMLPDDPSGKDEASARYGLFAMEQLINAMMLLGATRERMEIKIVGGGRVISGTGDVGRSNVDFVRHFLRNEKMSILVEDIGLDVARRVRYRPATGQLRVLHLPMTENQIIARRESELASKISARARLVDIELF